MCLDFLRKQFKKYDQIKTAVTLIVFTVIEFNKRIKSKTIWFYSRQPTLSLGNSTISYLQQKAGTNNAQQY